MQDLIAQKLIIENTLDDESAVSNVSMSLLPTSDVLEITRKLSGAPWPDIEPQWWIRNADVLPLLTLEAYSYHLPGILLACIVESQGLPGFALIEGVNKFWVPLPIYIPTQEEIEKYLPKYAGRSIDFTACDDMQKRESEAREMFDSMGSSRQLALSVYFLWCFESSWQDIQDDGARGLELYGFPPDLSLEP